MKDVDSEMELRDAFRVLDSDGAPELSRIACASPACVALGTGQQQPRARDAVGVTRICARPVAGLGYITCKEMTTICKVLGEDLDEIEVRSRPCRTPSPHPSPVVSSRGAPSTHVCARVLPHAGS